MQTEPWRRIRRYLFDPFFSLKPIQMKYGLLILFSVILISSCGLSKKGDLRTDAQPISHELWNQILQDNVKENGWFDYQAILANRSKFDQYLNLLNTHHPNPDTWTRNERMAYWFNAYNAYTVQLIVDNYPLESIKDIKNGIPFVNGVWDIKFIEIEGRSYSLNNIEHGILRPKFKDPRIHMAVNCASYSCPPLLKEAFEADRLQEQLDFATRNFLKDELRNEIKPESAKVSSIFKWYKGDFTKGQTLKDFLNKYLDTPIAEATTIEFLDYNWSLNDSSKQK